MIRLKSLSPIISSPREQFSWYRDLDFTISDIKTQYNRINEKLNQIYPFYRYGEYDYLNKGKAYIPGSTIKGILRNKLTEKYDDIEIEDRNIEVINLYKIQGLKYKDEKNPTKIVYDVFMPNIGIEAIKTGTELEIDGINKDAFILINDKYQKRLEKLEEYIEKVKIENGKRGQNKNEEIEIKLNKIIEELNILKNKIIFFIGGYKGLINSLDNFFIKNNGYESALFIDDKIDLPYGIFEVLS
jgi:hypothetical protein